MLTKRRLYILVTFLLAALLVFPFAPPAGASSPAEGRTVVVDPGHGGKDPGAVNEELGIKERDVNLAVSLRLRDKLKSAGAVPIMTRETNDKYLSLGERVEIANSSGGDIFISVHANAFTEESANGTETFYYPDGTTRGDASKILGKYVQEELVKALGFRDRCEGYPDGVKTAGFYVIANTKMPSILVELGFITNPEEGKLLATPEYQEKAAAAIFRGIERYFQAIVAMVPSIFGADRYATAVEIAKAGWSPADTVIITRGDDFADALAGTPLAHENGAPILLTYRDELPAATRDHIERMSSKRAVILGGTAAVSEAVRHELEEMGLTVNRIAGADRYATAAEIARRLDPSSGRAVVVRGDDFADALAAGPYAAREGAPVLLVKKDRVPAATEDALRRCGVTHVTVVGGESAIGEDVLRQLEGDGWRLIVGADPEPERRVDRVAGADRYGTAVEVARRLGQPSALYIASGQSFADALAGGALAARQEGAVLLTRKDRLPAALEGYLQDARGWVDEEKVAVLGGSAAVSDSVRAAVASIFSAS